MNANTVIYTTGVKIYHKQYVSVGFIPLDLDERRFRSFMI